MLTDRREQFVETVREWNLAGLALWSF